MTNFAFAQTAAWRGSRWWPGQRRACAKRSRSCAPCVAEHRPAAVAVSAVSPANKGPSLLAGAAPFGRAGGGRAAAAAAAAAARAAAALAHAPPPPPTLSRALTARHPPSQRALLECSELKNEELREIALLGALEAEEQQRQLEAELARVEARASSLEARASSLQARVSSMPDCMLKIAAAWESDGVVPDVMKAYLADMGTFCETGHVSAPHKLTQTFLVAIHNASPQCAALLRGNLWAPSSRVIEEASIASAGVRYEAGGSIRTEYVEAACKYFEDCGYFGPIQIAMDATALAPIVRVDQRTKKLVGFEKETAPMTSDADVSAAFASNKKVSQVQLVLAAPVQGGVSPMPIALIPRGAGKDTQTHVHVKQWYDEARRLLGVFGYATCGLAADGDSAVRQNYEDECTLQPLSTTADDGGGASDGPSDDALLRAMP